MSAWSGARLVAATLSAALAFGAAPAGAGEQQDKLAAQKLLTQGNQLVGEGDYVAALEKFKAAYERYPSPKILLNIGTTLRQLGRNVDAAEVYETYLHDPNADPARRADLERILGEIDAVVGRIRIRMEAPEAVVRVDGKQIENFENGMSVRVNPGEHTVVGEREGFPPSVQTFTLKPREEHLVVLRFSVPKPKRVVVTSPPPPPSTQRTIALVLGGVGIAGLGMSAVFGVLAKVNNDDAISHCLPSNVCDAEGVDLGGAAESQATVSTAAFLIGAGVLATGVVLLVTTPSDGEGPKPATAALRAGASARAGGAFFTLEAPW